MDRTLSRDHPLIVFKFIFCFLVLNCEFTILRGVAKRLPLYILLGNPPANVSDVVDNPLAILIQGVRGYWQHSRQFLHRKVSEGISNPLTNS
jgi:hypothetical protein